MNDFIKSFDRLSRTHRSVLKGRIVGKRQVGKISFYDLMHDHEVVQITMTNHDMEVNRGDIVEAAGIPKPTRDGCPGLLADSFTILQRCKISHFPDRKMGFAEGHRNRPIDLLANADSHRVFLVRAEAIKRLRRFLEDEEGFLEVETPVLSTNANGANARPFRTESVDGRPFFLRIAPELHLKRLIIGGFERVFEIGKVFRNEGIDAAHNPEFTSLELYQSYSWFREDLVPLVKRLFGLWGDIRDISIAQVIDIHDIFCECGIRLDLTDEEHVLEKMHESCIEHNLIDREARLPEYKLFDKLVGKFVEPHCQKPTILTGFPLFTSPLAAANPAKPFLADRLEMYIDGREVANGYQELTEADEQERRFLQQAKMRADGDGDSPLPDADYVETLRLGMPPTIGLGIGIDRLVMALTRSTSLKSTILFPQ